MITDALQAKLMSMATDDAHGVAPSWPVVVKMAPSGLAADAIGGSTIHRVWKIPVQQTGIARVASRQGEPRQVSQGNSGFTSQFK